MVQLYKINAVEPTIVVFNGENHHFDGLETIEKDLYDYLVEHHPDTVLFLGPQETKIDSEHGQHQPN